MKPRTTAIILTLLCLVAFGVESAAQRRTRRATPRAQPEASPTTQQPQAAPDATPAEPGATPAPPTPEQQAATSNDAPTDAIPIDAQNEFQRIAALPSTERIAELTSLARSTSAATALRARELLVTARATLGDELLAAGNAKDGVAQFRRALADAPAPTPERLFIEVIARFPANIYLRGERAAAIEIAREIEKKAGDDATRLLALAAFHLSVEQGEDAARLAQAAAKLAPESAPPYLVLGAAQRIRLRLGEAVAAYRRALEIAPDSQVARRNLADVLRATGQPEDALTLYRAILERDPADMLARTGVVLSLFDAGRREDAERELALALAPQSAAPTNQPPSAQTQSAQAAAPPLALLVGAAYWYAAQGEGERALSLAQRAVQVEPRYTWAQIARARALLALRRPADAEISLRAASLYGNFPTITYELANTLLALGLYDEAAEELARSFTVTSSGKLAANLAGRIPTEAEDFTTLLAPERRAAILQPRAASTPAEDEQLRQLLAFHNALAESAVTTPTAPRGRRTPRQIAAPRASSAHLLPLASAFAAGDDPMRFFRQLYVIEKLLEQRARITGKQADLLTIIEAATANIDRAANAPAANVATLAEDLSDLRRRAIAGGEAPASPPAIEPRKLANILRGRLDVAAGRVLLSAERTEEGVEKLRRALTSLPPGTEWRRTAYFYLGSALDAQGKKPEALDAYLRSYDRRRPNQLRRLAIETLYRQINGSLDGLDASLRAAETEGSNEVRNDE